MKFRSLLHRVILSHSFMLALAALIMTVALNLFLHQVFISLHAATLGKQAEALALFLADEDTTSQKRLKISASLEDLYSEEYGRYFYAVLDDKGQPVLSSLSNGKPIFNSLNAYTKGSLETSAGAVDVEGVNVPIERGGQIYTIQLGENLSHRDVFFDDVMKVFSVVIFWVVIPLILIVLGFDLLIFREALAPLRDASREAEEISERNLAGRISRQRMPAEVVPLVDAANRAFERLETAYRAQQTFSSDAAHELRTPLAVLRIQIENLTDTSQRAKLLPSVDHMAHMIEQLLHLAEVETLSVAADDVADLRDVALSVVALLAPLAIDRHREIELQGAEKSIFVHGRRELLFRALRNLVENALRYAPERSAVIIRLAQDGTVSVLDTGPGIPDDHREQIFNRFWRHDRNKSGSSGLGLAIVKRIADLHDAKIEIADNLPHGTIASLHLKPIEQSSAS